jgi:RNA polymerase-binding transcription factor DksA
MSPAENAKTYLVNRQHDLTVRLYSVERGRNHSAAPLSQDSEERATELENDEVLERLSEATRSELSRVNHALQRLAAGRYGECEYCGAPIGETRLRIVPEATCCVRCAKVRRSN